MLAAHVAQRLRDSDKRIVITGASGWLGRATLDLLNAALGNAFASRVRCFGSKPRELVLADGGTIEQRPLEDLPGLDRRPTFVLHLAFLTKDRAESMAEIEYRAANRRISSTVLDCLDGIGADAVFVASSGAASFADNPEASPAMRLYGSLKREDEEAFAAWAKEPGRTAVIARIFNVSGPHINKHGSYALASFILDGLAGGPVVVKAPHDVVRGYVAIRELMSLVFALLFRGPGVLRFDTGGEPIELGALAELVASELGSFPVSRPPRTGMRVDSYVGDDARYRLLLSENGVQTVPLRQQIIETAEFLRKNQSDVVRNGVAAGVQP